MEISIAQQTFVFLYSILLGVILSVIYEVIRIMRVWGINKLHQLVISDCVFMIFCGFITFLFALAFSRGYVRFYIYIGEAIGFVLYRYTIGELTARLYSPIIFGIKKILDFICKVFKKLSEKLLINVCEIMYNIKKKNRFGITFFKDRK